MYIDIFYFDNVAFLVGVTKPMGLATCTPLGKGEGRRADKVLESSLRRHVDIYKNHGFRVNKIYSDRDAGIIAAASRITNLTYVALAAGQKDGVVDARIKFIKTTARAIKAGLPYATSTVL
jgi:hypothetical protein